MISEGSVLFIWGKGDTGCLGFGDEQNIQIPTAHPIFRDCKGFTDIDEQ